MTTHFLKFRSLLVIGTLLALSAPVQAQDVTAPPAATYTQAQLDQMIAPIALYPDPLIGQVLMASTYPLEVVEASRWLQNPGNAGLTGDQLATALDQQPWDPSVKALVPVPQVLKMLDSNIQWTEQLGDAFLAQQAAVTDSVQRLRRQAEATGALTSTAQQTVEMQGSDIAIEPENPDVVYVPAYNPMVVYGSWPYAGYPPYSFYPADYAFGGLIGFGVGVVVADRLWGWDRWDWRHHRIDIDDHRYSELNRGRPPSTSGVWQHDPAHRGGVPYRDAGTRAHFQPANAPDARRAFRGYPASPAGSAQIINNRTPSQFTPQFAAVANRAAVEQARSRQQTAIRPAIQHAPPAVPMQRPAVQNFRAAPAQRPATPVFESFSRGPEVRAQSQRGSMSRASVPAPQMRATPAMNNAPRGGGGAPHGGGGNRDNGGHR